MILNAIDYSVLWGGGGWGNSTDILSLVRLAPSFDLSPVHSFTMFTSSNHCLAGLFIFSARLYLNVDAWQGSFLSHHCHVQTIWAFSSRRSSPAACHTSQCSLQVSCLVSSFVSIVVCIYLFWTSDGMHLEQYVHSAPVSPTWPSKGNLVISQSCRHLANLTYCTELLMHRKFATQWRSQGGHGGHAPPPPHFWWMFFSPIYLRC